jgi:hypothetical protein
MATLTKEIANPDLAEGARQMACIIFKNFIANKNNVSGECGDILKILLQTQHMHDDYPTLRPRNF